MTVVVGSSDAPSFIEKVGFAAALDMAEALGQKFPLLRRATADMQPATKSIIEWAGRGYNFVQINRNPWSQSHAQLKMRAAETSLRNKTLLDHLYGVEQTLEHGIPQRTTSYHLHQNEDGWYIEERVTQTCGGYRHFLGRDLLESDTFRLRPLRDLALLTNRQAPDFDGYAEEWISEFSLEVSPS